MDGERFKSMLNEMLPREAIEGAIVRLGVKKRERRIDPVELTWATIFAGGTENCGRLASGIRMCDRISDSSPSTQPPART